MDATPDEPNALNDVAAFQRRFDCPIADKPCIAPRAQLRVDLLQEELNELSEAIKNNDLVEVADALADLQYVLSGAVLEFGMATHFKALFDEVHRSNMSKACPTIEDARATVAHYKAKGFEGEIRDSTGKLCEDAGAAPFLVYRKPDGKVLKSVSYSSANLGPILSK